MLVKNRNLIGSAVFFFVLISTVSFVGKAQSAQVFSPPTNSTQPPRAVPLDFDGDGKSDIATARISTEGNNTFANYTWYILNSSNNQATIQPFGNLNAGDKLIPMDYDGDKITDFAVYRAPNPAPNNTPGVFYIIQSASATVRVIQWGIRVDDPFMTQDFDGDGKADPTVVRRFCQGDGTYTWYILLSSTNYQQARIENFGSCQQERFDRPIRGDFDGDGKADLAFFRLYELNPDNTRGPVSNTFNIKMSGKRRVQKIHIAATDNVNIVDGDFDGDGKTDLASVISRFDGTYFRVWWEIYHSSTGRYEKVQFGYANGGGGIGDGPAPADYDGDGKTDITVTREIAFGERIFIIRNSSDGSVRWVPWGLERYENNPARLVYVRDR